MRGEMREKSTPNEAKLVNHITQSFFSSLAVHLNYIVTPRDALNRLKKKEEIIKFI